MQLELLEADGFWQIAIGSAKNETFRMTKGPG